MTAHRTVVGALALTAALWPMAARAQHGPETKAPATGTAKPAPDKAGTHPADTTGKPAASAAAPKNETDQSSLKSTIDRLNQRIKAEVEKPSAQTRAATPAASVASARFQPPAAFVAPSRIQLRWRIGLTWPAGLDDQQTPSSEERISLSWR